MRALPRRARCPSSVGDSASPEDWVQVARPLPRRLRARGPLTPTKDEPEGCQRGAGGCHRGRQETASQVGTKEASGGVAARQSLARAQLLDERARSMRFAPTRSEEWLWRRLFGSKTGFPFRRQLVIGHFIVDLACTKVRLVVEIDGGYHEDRRRHDGARDRALAALGWSVLRVAEEEVFTQLDGVVARITQAAARGAQRPPGRFRLGSSKAPRCERPDQ